MGVLLRAVLVFFLCSGVAITSGRFSFGGGRAAGGLLETAFSWPNVHPFLLNVFQPGKRCGPFTNPLVLSLCLLPSELCCLSWDSDPLRWLCFESEALGLWAPFCDASLAMKLLVFTGSKVLVAKLPDACWVAANTGFLYTHLLIYLQLKTPNWALRILCTLVIISQGLLHDSLIFWRHLLLGAMIEQRCQMSLGEVWHWLYKSSQDAQIGEGGASSL